MTEIERSCALPLNKQGELHTAPAYTIVTLPIELALSACMHASC